MNRLTRRMAPRGTPPTTGRPVNVRQSNGHSPARKGAPAAPMKPLIPAVAGSPPARPSRQPSPGPELTPPRRRGVRLPPSPSVPAAVRCLPEAQGQGPGLRDEAPAALSPVTQRRSPAPLPSLSSPTGRRVVVQADCQAKSTTGQPGGESARGVSVRAAALITSAANRAALLSRPFQAGVPPEVVPERAEGPAK